MEQVTIQGTVYTKASVVAKQFRYTTDYLGQLCRGEKIACQAVGRSWYISEESLLAYQDSLQILQKSKSEKSSNGAISRQKTVNSYQEKTPVAPRVKRTVKHIHVGSQFLRGATPVPYSPIRYTADETDLLPLPQKVAVTITPSEELSVVNPRIEPVLPAEVKSAQVTVETSNKKPTNLTFTPLPAVPLRGKITVRPIVTTVQTENEALVSPEDIRSTRISVPESAKPATPTNYRFHAAHHLATPGATLPRLSVAPVATSATLLPVETGSTPDSKTPRFTTLYVVAVLSGLVIAFGGIVGVQSLTTSATGQSAGLSVRLDSLGAFLGAVINR